MNRTSSLRGESKLNFHFYKRYLVSVKILKNILLNFTINKKKKIIAIFSHIYRLIKFGYKFDHFIYLLKVG